MFCPGLCTFYVKKKIPQNFVRGGKITNIMYDHINDIYYTLQSPPFMFLCAPYPYLGWKVCFQKYTTRHIAEVSNITFHLPVAQYVTKDILPALRHDKRYSALLYTFN